MEEIMTPSEVAALLKIHLKTVYKLAERSDSRQSDRSELEI